jgi:DNA-binding MarR family transcriptional regulator
MTEPDASTLFLEVIPRCMRLIRGEMRQIAGAELTIPQYRLLARIAREPAGNQALAEWMGVRPATMCRMVDSLVRRKLVRRERPPRSNDRRKVLIRLTAAGRARSGRIRRLTQRVFAARMAVLPPSARDSLMAGLRVLKTRFT